MKRLHYLLITFIFFISGYSQEVKIENEELTKILCRNWKINSVVINGEKMVLSENILNSGLEFKIDNTFFEKPVTEKSEKGNWKYNKEKLCVELFNGDRIIGTIRFVSLETLIYLPFLSDEAKRFVKSSEMHLKAN